MRYRPYWIISIGILLVSSIASDVALAEGAVKSQTTQMTVIGVRCVVPRFVCLAASRQNQTLVLQSTQTPPSSQLSPGSRPQLSAEPKEVREFRVISTDLQRKDNAVIVPARWIQSQVDSKVGLAPQKFLSVPVQFDLNAVPQSGEYGGTLFVEHSEGDLSVPVMLKVKDSWHLAVPLLVLGVTLALLLAAYQADGFDRDDITVKMGQLRSQMRSQTDGTSVEAETAKIFQDKTEFYLVDVGTALDAKNWTDARKSFSAAQTAWSRWRKQADDWVDLYEYINEALAVHLGAGIPEASAYGQDLKSALKRIKREMADCETPQEFSERLKPYKEKVQQFLVAGKLNDRLNELRHQMGTAGEQWRAAVIDLEDRLNCLSLEDVTGLQAWQKEATELKQKMEESQPADSSSRGLTEAALPSIRNVPQARTANDASTIQQADWRLQAYRWMGHGVTIVLLGWVGFNQLYASNSTFGANAVADYSSLLAWGFTAEVTRDSVTKVFQKFKFPGATG
jgi:hypothetical protein